VQADRSAALPAKLRRKSLSARARPLFVFSLLASTFGTPSSPASADEWEVFGGRYQGMGGAGVAVAEGGAAAYWNPGALAFSPPLLEVDVPFGLSAVAEGDLLESADRLSDFFDSSSYEDTLRKVRRSQQLTPDELAQTVQFFVDRLPGFDTSGAGAVARANLGLNYRRGSWVLTGGVRALAGGDPELDTSTLSFVERDVDVDSLIGPGMDHSAEFMNPASQALADSLAQSSSITQEQAEELVFQAERGGIDTGSQGVQELLGEFASGSDAAPSDAPNGSGILLRGLYTKQVGLAWGSHVLPATFGDRLGLGVHVQFIHGTTVRQFFGAMDGGDDSIGTEDRRRSKRMSLDVGLLYEPNDWLRLGLSARRVNGPSFPTKGGSPILLRPQLRAGAAVSLSSRWLIAADLDLSENESDIVDGFRSRVLALGTEYRANFVGHSVDLRFGVNRNLSTGPNRDIVITAGFGLYLGNFRFDLALGSGLDRERFDQVGGTKIPRRVELTTGIRWLTEF
jgi:hypothetical protein